MTRPTRWQNYAGHKILGNEEASTADAVEAFMQAEADLAEELNLENSSFVTPDGDQADNQYTTARDMVRIARACMENETIMRLCGASTYRALFDNKDVTYRNTNQLLQPSSDSYYEGANGLKTGSYNDLKCLVASAEINGKSYVAAIMQGSDTGRYADAKTHTRSRVAQEREKKRPLTPLPLTRQRRMPPGEE